jgi:manganese efflux pump family protein
VWLSLLSLALALSMDAMAVSAARGLASSAGTRVRDTVLLALSFGAAQGLMPVAGWWLGARVGERFAAWDHWVAFVLLVGIGVKMLKEAFEQDDDEAGERALTIGALFVLAVATSIDSFAAGITLPMLGLPLLTSVLTIGVVTALLSGVAAWFAQVLASRFGERFGKRLEMVGGVVLIGLGIKVLVEHTLLV